MQEFASVLEDLFVHEVVVTTRRYWKTTSRMPHSVGSLRRPGSKFWVHCIGYSKNSHGRRSVAATYPLFPDPTRSRSPSNCSALPTLRPRFLSPPSSGALMERKRSVVHISGSLTPLSSTRPLPEFVSVPDVVSLPTAILPAWVRLVKVGRIEKDSVILIHDALSRMSLCFFPLEMFSLTHLAYRHRAYRSSNHPGFGSISVFHRRIKDLVHRVRH